MSLTRPLPDLTFTNFPAPNPPRSITPAGAPSPYDGISTTFAGPSPYDGISSVPLTPPPYTGARQPGTTADTNVVAQTDQRIPVTPYPWLPGTTANTIVRRGIGRGGRHPRRRRS